MTFFPLIKHIYKIQQRNCKSSETAETKSPHLAQASATSAAAAFSLCLCVGRICPWWRPESWTSSSSQEQSRPSRPLRQSVGSLLRLSGWQSLRQASSTSAVTLQSAGSLRVWDCKRGKTSSRPTREVKGACSGCWSRPCLFSKANVSSSAPPVPSRSCCSSRANCRCAPHRPRRALRRYSSRRAYALLWFPQTARRRSASSTGFFVSNVRICQRKTYDKINNFTLTTAFKGIFQFLHIIVFNKLIHTSSFIQHIQEYFSRVLKWR